jgi:hypothetical protein
MNETVAVQLLSTIVELETQVAYRADCCGCSMGTVEDSIDQLRDLIDTYRDGPKRPGY